VTAPSFAALIQDYLRLRNMLPQGRKPGRMVAIVGDAELDEGSVFEALLEGWKHDVRNVWWVIDYNRQSLDSVVADRLWGRIDQLFAMMGWRVVTLKYGKKLQRVFAEPDGEHLRDWIDACPNSLYSALVYKGGPGWREHLKRDLNRYPGIRRILDAHTDEALHALMTNLAGHDMESLGLSLVFFVIGQLTLHVFVSLFRALTTYDDGEQIAGENLAAALSYAGIAIAVSIIIARATEGEFTGWESSLKGYGGVVAAALALYPVRQLFVQMLLLRAPFALRGGPLDEGIDVQRSEGIGALEAATYVATALSISRLA
jgi:uncharacterized membrane protein YjfL (UPF0719 family)